MNKKGFTLVELLAVIIIVALLITITSTSVLGVMKDVKEDIKQKEFDNFLQAGETYIHNVLDKQDYFYVQVSSGTGKVLTGYDLLEYVGTCDITAPANANYCGVKELENNVREYHRTLYFDSAILKEYIDFDGYNIVTEKVEGQNGSTRYITKAGAKNLCKLKATIYVTTIAKGNAIYYELSKIKVEGRQETDAKFCVK